jgi:predicted ATPase/DNA-binding SARP family transcriptional activator
VTVELELIGDVRWRGTAVVGDRTQALLAALAASGGRTVRAEDLAARVWGSEAPANASKSLQVLVSRTRSACGPEVIVRDGVGYRLGVEPDEVDSVRLSGLVDTARRALERDAATAGELAREALALAGGLPSTVDGSEGPLPEVRRAAAADLAAARVIVARSGSRIGAHADALPVLAAAYAERPEDESLLGDLLRSEAVVRGPAAALERFERYRRDLRERLGINPGESLQRTHLDLLALDRPVRRGVRYETTRLLGRDRDIERLRAAMRSARVVSIVGPGGIGKTRLAHVLARDAAVPVTYVVELAGVSSPEDVVGEIGSVLEVRDSVGGRQTLTSEQRADVRARIAQRLGQSSSLLVLDNCEHLIGAVAALVAFLVSTTAELRVLTTSRAPLAIAAERVYLLGELGVEDATELFRERAVAARPDAQLADGVVTRIVTTLDGLPLAIELAAAKVRAMSVEEIDRRLENRFALLRGGDRSAPGRHQTLLAVIDWSWNLLDADQRRALRWLALFNDGFTLEAAGAVLGADAVDSVQGLVDQSLLSVLESGSGVRYRMLETVREFGRMQLVDAGEDAEARTARRRWATAYASEQGRKLLSAEQFAAIDALSFEELNLADELRDALASGDNGAVVVLLAALGTFWAMRGEHARLVVLTEAVVAALTDWRPPAELEDVTRAALGVVLSNTMFAGRQRTAPVSALLKQLGPGTGSDSRQAGMTTVMLAYDPSDAGTFLGRLERLADDPDRGTSLAALQWLTHFRENTGDAAGAVEAAERALALTADEDGPWNRALLHTQLSQLTMQLGHTEAAIEHARSALGIMQRLGARDDEVQLRSLLGACAIAQGRLADAEAELERIDRIDDTEAVFGGRAVRQVSRAELALARGDHPEGLRLYRESAALMRGMAFPGIPRTGREPWTLFGVSTALVAHAYYAAGGDEEHGRALFGACRADALKALEPDDLDLDFPAAGMLLFALGAWGVLRAAMPTENALRLLALSDRFGYNRAIPTLAWERLAPRAEELAPGRLAELQAMHVGRRPDELLGEAHALVEQLPS